MRSVLYTELGGRKSKVLNFFDWSRWRVERVQVDGALGILRKSLNTTGSFIVTGSDCCTHLFY